MKTIIEPTFDKNGKRVTGGVYDIGNIRMGAPKTKGIKLGVFDCNYEFIGYKTDTFWTLDKERYKEHGYGDEDRLIDNFIHQLNGKGVFGKHEVAEIHRQVLVLLFDLKDNKILKEVLLTELRGVWQRHDKLETENL